MKTPIVKKSTVLTTKGAVVAKPKVVETVEAPESEAVEMPEISTVPLTEDLSVTSEENVKFAPPSKNDLVKISMYEDCSAPTIGPWRALHELKVSKMLAREIYQVPRYVAEHLISVGRAMMVN